ncbi:protein FAR1-RELATED SEQUENCE 6-like [Chenopodium quinoa]|uniref:protein FAR1-RELATED SEQUENCE 6-like n=1 Tax=Chenopodium quinoa TaxID=63459 RepID=UPI000B76C367|nr:protein FAR1-RELATED SEQUENCE 6-like [Chenopodium quinoa]
MTTYKLEENDWLSDLYDERHMWVPAFMKEHFWAGMKTTQRVESINSFFDGFVNRKTRLYEFPEKYTRAMARRVKAENEADARCGKYRRRLEIQIECCRLMHCSGREERDLGGNIIQYLLEDRVWIIPEGESEEVITDRRRFYSVLFNTVTKEVSCDCRKFETFGILCRHVIRVYDKNLVFDIPPKYVLRRWRKDVSRKHTRVKVAYHDPTENVAVQTYNNLMAEFLSICDLASSVQDKATVDLVAQSMQKLPLEVQAIDTHGSVSKPEVEEGNTSLQTAVKDPISRKKPRGRPKGSRHKSLAETGYKKNSVKKGKNIAGTQMDPAVQQPTAVKLPRKRTQVLQQQNTIENYYDFVEDDAVGGDDILMRNGLGWSGPSDTF